MLHAKFQNHRPSGSGEVAFYSHGGHLSQVTWTIYKYKLLFPIPKNAPQEVTLICFDLPGGFRGEDL